MKTIPFPVARILYMYRLDKGVYPPSPPHRISNHVGLIVLNCHLFVVVSLDTPVLPTKQWEEHLKLRTLVEKIREKQTGMISVDVLQFCCTILYSCLVKLIILRGSHSKWTACIKCT